MDSWNLESLELEGFRSFRERQVVTFPKGNNVVLISGHWKDSETSSGSGKSSILEAIAFVLDVSSVSQTSLKNWHSKKMYVKLTLQKGAERIEVIRDPKLSLVLNGVSYNAMAKGAKDKLREVLGVSDEMLRAMIYRKQRKPGTLVRATDSEIKEFLSKPLGLGEIEAASEKFAKDATELSAHIELLKRDVDKYESNLSFNRITDEELHSSYSGYLSAKDQYERISVNTPSGLKEKSNSIRSEISKIREMSFTIQSKKRDNASLKDSIIRAKSELDHITGGSCPTCLREWEASRSLVAERSAQIDSMIGAMQVNLEYIKNAEPMISNVSSLEELLSDIDRQVGEASAPIGMAYQALMGATSTYNLLAEKKRNYDKIIIALEGAKTELAKHQRELDVNAIASRLMGRSGFMGSIFDEILTDIEIRSNDMLASYPNANQLTIHVRSSRSIKSKGTTKKEISISISKNGVDIPSIEDVSGGQQAAIELCTDLAAAEVIKARSGSAIGWMSLDEVLDGLGSSEKESVVDMIKKRAKGLVLMIEHATEIKESFDQVIDVEYDGKDSNVIT